MLNRTVTARRAVLHFNPFVVNIMLENEPQFLAFDPDADVDISARNLPHWFQPGVATFITLRTIDSMPADVLDLWDRQQRDWLLRQVGNALRRPKSTA